MPKTHTHLTDRHRRPIYNTPLFVTAVKNDFTQMHEILFESRYENVNFFYELETNNLFERFILVK